MAVSIVLLHFLELLKQFLAFLAISLWLLVLVCELQKLSADQLHLKASTWIWFLHLLPVQNPQADHCRLQEVGTYCQESRRLDQWVPELVLQERWRVRHHIHEQKQELSGFRYSRTDVAHAGMAWSGLGRGCLDWPAGTKGSPSVKQSGDLFTKSVLCQSYKQKIWIPFRPHFYIVSKTKPKFLFCALTETCPHPNLNLEYLCVFCGVDRNAVMKLCTTFQCILT